MNLHKLVRNAISKVNPYVDAEIFKSNGYEINRDFKQVPNFLPAIKMRVQKQAINQEDLEHVANINLQGQYVSIYTDGNWCGLNRNKEDGGDLFVIGDERWLVVMVPEIWPDWTRVIACLQ